MWINAAGLVVRDWDEYVGPDGTKYPANFPKSEIHGLSKLIEVKAALGPNQRYGAPYAVGAEYHYPVEDIPAAELQQIVASKIDQLWRAADAYVNGYISGVAIGLLALGVMQQLPKALAVSAWSSSVWDDYYTRKAAVTVDSALDLDFSSHGPMPYTVPELRAELGM